MGGCTGSVFLTMVIACVDAKAGAFDWNETGSRLGGASTRPLLTKTLPCVGFETTTRGGWTPVLPVCEAGGSTGGAPEAVPAAFANSPDSVLIPIAEIEPEVLFCGKRGVVLALGGAPVKGGAEGFDASDWEGGLETLGIGFVTAVDQLGAVPGEATGSRELDVFKGNVVAAEMLGRAAGAILVDAGLSGRGGKLIRKVSRFGAFGSEPGVAESAIIMRFYSYFGKSSTSKFAIATYLWT